MAKKLYDTVLFDLDGTVLNTLTDLTNGVNYALDALGMMRRTEEEIRIFIGDGVYKLLERSMGGCGDESEISKAVDIFREHYSAHQTDNTLPYKGIPELLDALKNHGVNTAIVSNKRDSNVKALSEHFFKEKIMLSLGNIDFSKRKPDPYLINKAIDHFGTEKARVLYIGDSEIDIKAAANAGIDCLCVSYGFRKYDQLKAAGAKNIAKNSEEILKYIIQEDV